MRTYPRAAPVVKTERKDNFVTYFLYSSAQMCSHHTPGLRQPHIYHGRVLYTVTRVWVCAMSPAHAVDIHDAVIRFVYRCLSQTLNLSPSQTAILPTISQVILALHVPAVYIRFFCSLNIRTCVVNISGLV